MPYNDQVFREAYDRLHELEREPDLERRVQGISQALCEVLLHMWLQTPEEYDDEP